MQKVIKERDSRLSAHKLVTQKLFFKLRRGFKKNEKRAKFIVKRSGFNAMIEVMSKILFIKLQVFTFLHIRLYHSIL